VGGTEAHLLTLGEHLQRLGHEVAVYSPETGSYADHLAARGIEVYERLRTLPADCDVVFSQDTLVAHDLARRYESAAHVFRVCGDMYDFQLPPQLEGVVDAIVVLSDRYARAAKGCAARTPVVRLRVPVDVDRLVPLGCIRERPRRAVLLGNYPQRHHAVRCAWGRHGVEMLTVGNVQGSQQSFELATALADADIVVAKSRAALDAMACGRAVYIYDCFGGDGWVTPRSYPALEADNFAGLASERVIGVTELERDLADYSPAMGSVNRDLIVQHHNARDHVLAFLDAIAEHLEAPPKERRERPAPLRELARLTALQWSWERTARELQGERAWHHDRTLHAERGSEEAHARAGQLHADLDAALQRVDSMQSELAHARAHAEALRREAETLRGDADALRGDLREVEARLARAIAHAGALSVQVDAMRSTRAWGLATRYWRLKRALARAS
jgi:hypothetical protein